MKISAKTIFKISIYSICVLIIIGYSIFTAKDYLSGPKIVILEPQNGANISTSSIKVRGNVSKIKEIYLNDRPIFIDQSGDFEESLVLEKGYNAYLLKVNDRFGRNTEEKIELTYTPQ